MARENTSSSGIGFFGLLTILFIGLKLTGFIDWSRWYVLMPWYGPVVLVIAIGLITLLLSFLLVIFKEM